MIIQPFANAGEETAAAVPWDSCAVLWAAEKQITAGTDETHFSPAQSCTRAQVVTFLYQYCTGNDTAE